MINPGSGGKKFKPKWEEQIREHQLLQRVDARYYNMCGDNDLQAIKTLIDRFAPEKLVAVGGDGTVSLAAKLIMGTPIKLGIIPAGSANGMAKELNLPSALNECIDIILNGKSLLTDIININNDLICLHLADIGMNARLIKYFDSGNIRGKLGYAKVLFKVFWRKELIRVTLKTDNGTLHRKAFMVVLANARKYGTGAVINPKGQLQDGLFELVIVRRLALSEIFKTIFRPGPFNEEKIEIIQTARAEISCSHPAHFQVDGEYLGRVRNVSAKISTEKLHVLVDNGFDPSEL